jgi:hypothetical protein
MRADIIGPNHAGIFRPRSFATRFEICSGDCLCPISFAEIRARISALTTRPLRAALIFASRSGERGPSTFPLSVFTDAPPSLFRMLPARHWAEVLWTRLTHSPPRLFAVPISKLGAGGRYGVVFRPECIEASLLEEDEIRTVAIQERSKRERILTVLIPCALHETTVMPTLTKLPTMLFPPLRQIDCTTDIPPSVHIHDLVNA